MSKSKSEEKYESLKAYYREQAAVKEKELHMDLLAVRHEYVPHHLKRKFLTGLGVFGTVYLVEKLIFGKKLPRIVRFTTSLSATVFAPRLYRLLEEKFLALGELEPVELEMLEDQQLSQDAVSADSAMAGAENPSESEMQPFTSAPPSSTDLPAADNTETLPSDVKDIPLPPADTGKLTDTDKSEPQDKA
jgi:hypothetical protein